MTKTLVERLRVEYPNAVNPADAHDAANEIMALRAERHQLQNDLTAAGLENGQLRAPLTELLAQCDDYFHGDSGFPLSDAMERARTALSGSVEPSDGYRDAFYAIGELIGLTAMPISPKEAFETRMLPVLRELLSRAEKKSGEGQ